MHWVALFCAHCCFSLLFPLGIVFTPPLVPVGFADIFSELYHHFDLLFTEVAQFICVNVICSALTFLVGWLVQIHRIIDLHYIGLREKSSWLIFHKVWCRLHVYFNRFLESLHSVRELPLHFFSFTTSSFWYVKEKPCGQDCPQQIHSEPLFTWERIRFIHM